MKNYISHNSILTLVERQFPQAILIPQNEIGQLTYAVEYKMKIIPLTQGKFALVDDSDFDWLNQWNWQLNHDGYAINYIKINGKIKKVRMHRLINNTPEGMDTDHRDGNKTNNQRYNLRDATRLQNMMNKSSAKDSSSKYKGVSWKKKDKKWYSAIKLNKKSKHLGCFSTEIEAAKAYNDAAIKYFGEFSRLNIITGE